MLISGAFWRIFLSTPSGWRATFCTSCLPVNVCAISIHALRVEGDAFPLPAFYRFHKISIHALRVEGDAPSNPRFTGGQGRFLSTPSGWRATTINLDALVPKLISIHALRVEGDDTK